MTLIASSSVRNCPIILGDLLVSALNHANNSLILPTIGKFPENAFNTKSRIPKRLIQKVVILNDNLVIAWCGNILQAKIIISRLYKTAQQKNIGALRNYLIFLVISEVKIKII